MAMKKLMLAVLLSAAGLTIGAQTVTVKDTTMTTYPFGDPNPIPQVKRNCYPYCTFEQFATTSTRQTWKMVVLENPYLRVKIFPEIGGKIWSVFDKTAGKEMFYDNDAGPLDQRWHRIQLRCHRPCPLVCPPRGLEHGDEGRRQCQLLCRRP